MIDIDKLVSNAVNKNLDNFAKDIAENPETNVINSQSRIYKLLLHFSSSLLGEYHEQLKMELAKKNIEI